MKPRSLAALAFFGGSLCLAADLPRSSPEATIRPRSSSQGATTPSRRSRTTRAAAVEAATVHHHLNQVATIHLHSSNQEVADQVIPERKRLKVVRCHGAGTASHHLLSRIKHVHVRADVPARIEAATHACVREIDE